MEEVKNKVNEVLTDYGNFNFLVLVRELLLLTNKQRCNIDNKILKNIILTYNDYIEDPTEDNLYTCKDTIIVLYNELIN